MNRDDTETHEVPDGTAATPARAQTGAWFVTTRWSLVLAARQDDAATGRKALEHLCTIYWPPIYAFIRREGHPAQDAEDLTQGFFAHILEKDFLTHLKHQEGRFRSFLLKFLKHYLSDQRDRAGALKRGGGKTILSLDQLAEEQRLQSEPADTSTPEQAYERRYVQALLDQAVARLKREYEESGRSQLFERFKDLQPGQRGDSTYAELGKELGMSEQAVKNAVLRFRDRYTEILHDEIAQTVGDPAGLEDEIRHLLRLIAG